jgi:predicted dehydrogenase
MTEVSSEAFELIEMANEKGCILQVGHIMRFMEVVRKAKEILPAVGKLKYISFRWTHNYSPATSEDVIWDLLPHPLDMIHFITGKFPSDWKAYHMKENAHVILGYDSFTVQGELSWVTQIKQRIMCIVGTNSTIVINTDNSTLTVHKDIKKAETISIPQKDAIKEEAKNFITSIKNKTMEYNSGIIGARNTDIVGRIIESSKTIGMEKKIEISP